MQMQVKKSEPFYQQVFEILRNMIIQGDLPPGTKLSEEKLAAQLGVSRTPIREAMMRLEQDGLIQEKTVIQPSEQDVRNCYEIRILLEGYSARMAALSLSDNKKKLLLETLEIVKRGTFEEAVKANTAFHDLIIEASGNQRMVEILQKMRSLILLCRHQVVKNRPCLPSEHEGICEAILAGNADAAERLMKEHLQSNLDLCLKAFRSPRDTTD